MKYTHAPSANRYRNSKTANAYLKKNMFVKRKLEQVAGLYVNNGNAKRIYGPLFPAFGAALGAGFDKDSGTLSKVKRAQSIM